MRSAAMMLAGVGCVLSAPLWAREVVDASAPVDLAVTIYRDPDRDQEEGLDPDYPGGLAMISETRRVTLPKGESTIRFEGVAEGMIGVSAIVTGLPGGTIEKNRNADLLSPAALVDGTLGNRVRLTRTNPATGRAESRRETGEFSSEPNTRPAQTTDTPRSNPGFVKSRMSTNSRSVNATAEAKATTGAGGRGTRSARTSASMHPTTIGAAPESGANQMR